MWQSSRCLTSNKLNDTFVVFFFSFIFFVCLWSFWAFAYIFCYMVWFWIFCFCSGFACVCMCHWKHMGECVCVCWGDSDSCFMDSLELIFNFTFFWDWLLVMHFLLPWDWLGRPDNCMHYYTGTVLCCCCLCVLFVYLFICFLKKERKGVELGEWASGMILKEFGGEKFIIRIYCMKKIKEQHVLEKSLCDYSKCQMLPCFPESISREEWPDGTSHV